MAHSIMGFYLAHICYSRGYGKSFCKSLDFRLLTVSRLLYKQFSDRYLFLHTMSQTQGASNDLPASTHHLKGAELNHNADTTDGGKDQM